MDLRGVDIDGIDELDEMYDPRYDVYTRLNSRMHLEVRGTGYLTF
jgi:hypothetical protein